MFWRMLVIKRFLVPIDFYSIFAILWKSMETNILQSIFFYVQKKKETQVWNNLRVSKWWQMNLWVYYPFKIH